MTDSQNDVDIAIADVEFSKGTHIRWAEFFEKNPDIEAEYVATGEWNTAEQHREIAAKYDRVLRLLNVLKEQGYGTKHS